MAERLNLGPSGFLALGVAGVASSYAIAHWVPPGGRWLSWLFIAYAVYGTLFAIRALGRARRFVRDAGPDLTVGHVYSTALMRREGLKLLAYIDVLVIGVLSLDPQPWFGTFFTAAMFHLVYTMNVNSTLDDTLGGRLRRARDIEAERAAAVRKRKPRKATR